MPKCPARWRQFHHAVTKTLIAPNNVIFDSIDRRDRGGGGFPVSPRLCYGLGKERRVISMANNNSPRRSFDLDGMSVAELTALRDAAEAKRLEKLEDAKTAVIERARGRCCINQVEDGLFPSAL